MASALVQQLGERLDAGRPEGAAPLGWRCFQIALLFLASSAFIAGLLLVVALIQGSLNRPSPWRDRANWVLAAAAVLMVLGCFGALSGWLAWVGLANWLPFFWAFWGFQPYVATPGARRRMGLWLVAGTVPVVLTGTVSTNPVADQLDLARQLQPALQRLGLIYDPAQANASFEAELLRGEAAERQLRVEAEPVTGPADVAQAARHLLNRGVEAFMKVGDYATIEAFPQLAALALHARVPVYSVDAADITVPGCLAVVGWDPRSDGLQAAALAVRVLRGTSPAVLPFEQARDQLLLLNGLTAQRLGIGLPASLRARADRVVG